MNELLISCMKKTLANLFVVYFKAHSFHWNVTGIHFSQMHSFFGSLYEELHGSVDPLAEQLRAIGEFAPVSLAEIYNPNTIKESELKGSDVLGMLAELLADNEVLKSNYEECLSVATKLNNQGLADYLAGRIDAHSKMSWMIRSHLQ